jgi:hypothetical protein
MLRGSLALALACLVLGAVLKLPEAVQTPGTDTGLYATYGRMLLHGARPYVDFWDVHPPLVYVYWALVEAVSGGDWSRTCFAIPAFSPQSCTNAVAQTLDLALSVVSALLVAGIVRRLGGSGGVAALAAVLVVGFANQSIFSVEGSNPSKLTLVPSTLAAWAYVRSLEARHPWQLAALAGVAGGVAVLAKQPAILTLLALAGHAAWRRDLRRLRLVCVGALAILLAACALMALTGSLNGFIEQAWIYNVQRTLSGYFVHPAKPPTLSLARVLMEGGAVLAVLAIAGAVVLARAPRLCCQRVLLWWATADILAVFVFREFVFVVPSLAAVGAFGLDGVWRWTAEHVTRRQTVSTWATALVLVGCAIPTMSFQRVQVNRAWFERGPSGGLSQPEQLGAFLRGEVTPGALYVYGNAAEIYPLSGRLPATPYVNAEALRSTAPGVDETRDRIVAELRHSPPPVVLLAPHSDEAELNLADYGAMREFLETCYQQRPLHNELDVSWSVLVRADGC